MPYTSTPERDALERIAEFDHPFTVGPAGELADAPAGIYAPEIYHDDAGDITGAGSMWEALTGYTSQHGYRGAVMHSSEFLGGRLADDILSTPGVYVVVTVDVLPHVTYPHTWSDSGARCTACGLIGNGSDNGSCPAHPDYDPELVDDDEDPEPAGWAAMRLRHADYPHEPGRLFDCPACEAQCHCAPGEAECVYSGPHRNL